MEPILSLFKKRDLLWQFLLRNVKSRHRGSILGAFWLVVNPLLMLGLYVFAFGVVFGGRFTDSPDESTLDYALGVFLGFLIKIDFLCIFPLQYYSKYRHKRNLRK